MVMTTLVFKNILLQENLLMIELMGTDIIVIQMVPLMKEFGKMIVSKDMGLNYGAIDLCIWENI